MNCKIVSVYFGNRQRYPHTSEDTLIMLKDFIKNEISLNPGVDQLDTILVNHNCNNKEGNKYLDSLEGLKTHSGNIKVIHRPWNKGIGMSFASFNYAFEQFRDDYDYWFFQEDDYKLIHENYYSKGIEILNKNPKLAFLGYDRQLPDNTNSITWEMKKATLYKFTDEFNKTEKEWKNWDEEYQEFKIYFDKIWDNIGKQEKKYYFCDGGMGLTHKKFLNEIYNKNNSLPYCKSPQPKEYMVRDIKFLLPSKVWWVFNVVFGEIRFTNIYVDHGYELNVFPSSAPIIHSYKANENR